MRQRWTVKKVFCYLLYVALAKHLPDGVGVAGRLAISFRRMITRPLLRATAGTFSIGQGAEFGNGKSLVMRDHANLGRYALVSGNGVLTIGSHVMMGEQCIVITQNHRYLREGYDGYEVKDVEIGDAAWIGHRVTILPGVKIGRHAIIGAGAVVTRDVPDYAIAAGNPARVIRFRGEASAGSGA